MASRSPFCIDRCTLATHVSGGCLVPQKNGVIPQVGPTDTDCGCLSALKIRAEAAIQQGVVSLDHAQSLRFYGKGLVFANRAPESIPYTQKAASYFFKAYGKKSIDGLVIRADLAMAFGCSGKDYWERALSMWQDIQRDLQCLPETTDGAMLRQQLVCDKFFAESTLYTTIEDRARCFHKAFEAGHPIQHPFLMRIIVELEIIGLSLPSP